ncbi:ABC transporter ATP-binding protein [Endozoicomonas sp. ONNA2]|uniref:ABC transporter ATP-binding protein n=1 Tax=Endozoicomonas sp. ONNA2 TaxID=2828741 RepID=UPI0021498AE2|nr:ABC transporter ATP-binding protein [Endozoicomonas sp. ONNA2]
MSALNINKLACAYDRSTRKNNAIADNLVLAGLNLAIEDGEIVGLLGPSGCGKSTLLKAIAGLIQPISGTIELHGKEVSSAARVTPPEQRGIGMIFQDYALFPHLTVFDNISFGLKGTFGRNKPQVRQRVQDMLRLVNLYGLHQRYPHELSGGQQQRVAIARALANEPSIVLLDEPFSNIDSQVRQPLVREIRDILKQQKVAGLLVTHSREEGFAFADTIAVMGQGRIMQQGTAFDIYHHPDNRFIADFMGAGNVLPATIEDEFHVSTPLGIVASMRALPMEKAGTTLELFIRPQMVAVAAVGKSEGALSGSCPQATITRQQFIGKSIRSEIHLGCYQVSYQLVAEHLNPVAANATVQLNIIPHDLVLFAARGLNALPE